MAILGCADFKHGGGLLMIMPSLGIICSWLSRLIAAWVLPVEDNVIILGGVGCVRV